MVTSTSVTATPAEVDARAPRFTATVTAAMLATALAAATVNPRAAAAILAVQAVIFGIGALWGPLRHPYGLAFSRLIAPKLGPVAKRDAVAQLRFAQMLGFFFCAIAAAGFALGAPVVGWISAGFALFAAVMRAAFGICLGKGPYMLACRLRGEVPACCRNK